MDEFVWRGRRIKDYDHLAEMMKIIYDREDRDEAAQFVKAYGDTVGAPRARATIGYLTGEFPEFSRRMESFFRCKGVHKEELASVK